MDNEYKHNRFNVSPEQGLSSEQVKTRKKQKLVNKSQKVVLKSYARIIFTNVLNPFNILLFAIVGLLIFFKFYYGIIFILAPLSNIYFGFVRDLMVRRTNEIKQKKVKAVRNGTQIELLPNELVLDDVLYFEKGDEIITDCLILKGEISLDESPINGQPAAVYKTVNNNIYSGSIVLDGKAYAKVNEIGNDCIENSINNHASQIRYSLPEIAKVLRKLVLTNTIASIIIAGLVTLSFLKQGLLNSDSAQPIATSLISMLPYGIYLCVLYAFYVGYSRALNDKIKIQDSLALESLTKIDTICFDKTNTITDGTFVIKKVVPLVAKYSESDIGQSICNIIRATSAEDNISLALLKYFDLQLTAGVNVALPFSCENYYYGASFKGGKTFILGNPEYMPLKNKIGVIKRCDGYINDGHRVFVLGEGKELINNNQYPGELDAIAIIVMKEHIRENANETFAWFKKNNIDVKIISSDDVLVASSIAAEAGISNADKYISLDRYSIDQAKEFALTYTVFGNATAEQKEAIILGLKESNKKVAMVGDGINDVLALKQSDCSIAMEDGSASAKSVSRIIINDSSFDKLPDVINKGVDTVKSAQRILTLFTARSIFACLISLAFVIFGLIDKQYLYPFTVNHFYVFDFILIIGSSLLISLDRKEKPLKGKFVSNVLKSAIPSGIVLALPVLFALAFCVLQQHGFVNLGIYNMNIVITMSIISFNVLGIACLFGICLPTTKYRSVVTLVVAAVVVIILATFGAVSYLLNDSIINVLKIPFVEMNAPSYFATAIMTVVLAVLYMLIYRIIDIKKGENIKDEN